MVARGHRFEDGLDQPGLADAGLADQEHRLALAGRGLPPALEHERELLVAPDHGRLPARPPGLEAAAGGALAEHQEEAHGAGGGPWAGRGEAPPAQTLSPETG